MDGETARYYPYTCLNVHNNALIDVIDGRRLVVYVDPVNANPGAFYTDAYRATWRGTDLNLGTGDVYRGGSLHTASGADAPERPKQMFVRWYARVHVPRLRHFRGLVIVLFSARNKLIGAIFVRWYRDLLIH